MTDQTLRRKAAVFLDRDGTIIEDRGYLTDPEQVVFIPGVFAALRSLGEACAFFIVTNQSGVSKGLTSARQVESVNRFVVDELKRRGIGIVETYVCPHDREDACECRKPSPYFLELAARRYGIDLTKSYVVGDHIHDIETAKAAGATGIYVLSGHGRHHLAELAEAERIVVGDICAAARVIKADAERCRDFDKKSRIHVASAILRAGGLVAFPTETVYGLGANVYDHAAVAKVFSLKRRPAYDPLIVHLAEPSWLDDICEDIPPLARRLAERFWPGPLTLVLKRKPLLPDAVCAGLPTVAARVPSHPLARQLLAATGLPLAAPSANPFGGISPTTAAHVIEGLPSGIDMVIDGGCCEVGLESTVIGFDGENRIKLLRPGGVTIEALNEFCGSDVEIAALSATPSDTDRPEAPGMLSRHYSPVAPLSLFPWNSTPETPDTESCGLLLMSATSPARNIASRFAAVEILSGDGAKKVIGRELFASLRRLDAAGVSHIYAETADDGGLGMAINDRLRRAAVRQHDQGK